MNIGRMQNKMKEEEQKREVTSLQPTKEQQAMMVKRALMLGGPFHETEELLTFNYYMALEKLVIEYSTKHLLKDK